MRATDAQNTEVGVALEATNARSLLVEEGRPAQSSAAIPHPERHMYLGTRVRNLNNLSIGMQMPSRASFGI